MAKPRRKLASVAEKPHPIRQDAPRPARTPRDLWIYLALFFTIFVVYSQVRDFEFVSFDDPQIIDNPHVNHGITRDGLAWAFTHDEMANWIPVTQLSHMLDFQLFGTRSGFHHLTNVLFHALATLLLFAFLRRATGARWRSALVAFLFGLHPLHVESVTWIAERKDVLSALFWFLSLWAYVRYAERPALSRYLPVLLFFGLGLMAKPMVVTLPFALLLLDVWPLRRLRPGGVPWQKALWEKVPFLALSGGVALATYLVQRTSGAVEHVSVHPIGVRIENALVSYVAYIVKMFWPAKLAVLYPYPPSIPAWQALLAGLAIAGISVAVVRSYKTFPHLAVGWLWYLGTLVPVIGLVQVGLQASADRYTYIPMVGLSIMLAWGAADVVRRWPPAKTAVLAFVAVACSAFVVVTLDQLQYWKDGESLYRRAVDVTEGNYTMQYDLGILLSKMPGHLPEAIALYQDALRTAPDYAPAHMTLGLALSDLPGGFLMQSPNTKRRCGSNPITPKCVTTSETPCRASPAAYRKRSCSTKRLYGSNPIMPRRT